MRLVVAVLSACLIAAAPAEAAKRPPKRKGGEVRRVHSLPKGKLARFIARQVGPARTALAAASAATSIPGAVLDPSDRGKLYLVRSYDIPSDDPSAKRLENLSWTYDSAIGAIALDSYGARNQAQQLLDQLAAVQRTDGSLDFAYDVSNGGSVQLFRTGTIAWVGYAALVHRFLTGTTRYNSLIAGTAKWLLARRLPSGLLAGGPDVSWVSTQNNMVAYQFLASLATDPVGTLSSRQLAGVASDIADGIDSTLTITPASGQLGFLQGSNDPLRPLDAQTLGVMYLLARGRPLDAHKVLNYVNSAFRVTGRSITKSNDPATYNQTYTAKGPLNGYRPYASAGPDVIWQEGTAQMTWASGLLGQPVGDLSAWSAVGPLQADRTVTDSKVNEYHVWPASAAASWSLIASLGFPR